MARRRPVTGSTPLALYVSATRGRDCNRLYIDTEYDPDHATSHDGAIAAQSACDVLAGSLANEGADRSAHEALGDC
jgi:hypothetical protein